MSRDDSACRARNNTMNGWNGEDMGSGQSWRQSRICNSMTSQGGVGRDVPYHRRVCQSSKRSRNIIVAAV